MNKDIIHIQHVSNMVRVDFYVNVKSAIEGMQKDGLEVEVQYQTSMDNDNREYFSCLILGRMK